jgi:hypothetical protein
MRYCLFCVISLGFLSLIAFSWHAPGITELPPTTSAGASAHTLFLASRSPASSAAGSLEKIRRLQECCRSQSCDVPHTDARSYRHAVGEALAVALAEHLGNFGTAPALAQSAVLSQEPIVQAEGLRMLAALPASAENLSALGNGLRDSSDPALIASAVQELRRYIGTSFETDAQRIVEELVGYGALAGTGEATSLVSPFINEHSYQEFREVLSRLDAGASAARLLREALTQYEQRHRS